jgi:RNA polymerase sigma-70 factor (ECF subfamily)
MEETLVSALKQRDPEALAALFECYADKIYRLAVGLVHDEQQADGIVQDTFLALIKHVDRFEGRSQISTWLYRVAYNESMMCLRRVHPEVNIDDMDDGVMPDCMIDWHTIPERVMSSAEAAHEMACAIASLSPGLRAVFTLRDIDECSTCQTAEILGISEAAVKVRLHRARLALRERLSVYFAERAGVDGASE